MELFDVKDAKDAKDDKDAIASYNAALDATLQKKYEEAAKNYLKAIEYNPIIFIKYNTKKYDYANSLPHNMCYLLLKNVITKSSPYYELIYNWIMNKGIIHKCKDWRIISYFVLGNIYGINGDLINANINWKQAINESNNIKYDEHSMAYSARLNAIANVSNNNSDIANATTHMLLNNQMAHFYSK